MADRNAKYRVGTWLRWMQNSRLVLGVVEYVEVAPFPKRHVVTYYTDNGVVLETAVLEARPND